MATFAHDDEWDLFINSDDTSHYQDESGIPTPLSDYSYNWSEQLAAWGIAPPPHSHIESDYNELGMPDPWVNPNAPEYDPPF